MFIESRALNRDGTFCLCLILLLAQSTIGLVTLGSESRDSYGSRFKRGVDSSQNPSFDSFLDIRCWSFAGAPWLKQDKMLCRLNCVEPTDCVRYTLYQI